MTETIHIDGVEIALSKDSISSLLADKKRELQEIKGRLDAMGLELEKEKQARAALEDPSALEKRLQCSLALREKCRSLMGHDYQADGKNDVEVKLDVIRKFYPDQTLPKDDPSYVEQIARAIPLF